jgi:MFS family permease
MPDRAAPDSGADAPLAWSGAADKASYYRLYFAYVVALFATGVATVALALFAFDLAGDESGAVMGTALSLKMAAYIGAAPLAAALTRQLPRKPLLIGLDLIRAASLLLLPFVTAVWQILVLVFVFSLASAVFTLVYQTVVPYLLANHDDYTRSLARSRIASELENSVSPLIAALLLLAMTAGGVFLTATGAFLVSAWLVQRADLPRSLVMRAEGVLASVLRGPRLFLATPDLRALIALDVAVACATAMVMVNTVVLVQGEFDLGREASAFAFAAFGAGAIVGALALPPALKAVPERTIMLGGAALIAFGLMLGAGLTSYYGLIAVWIVLGLGGSLALTPATYLIRRIGRPADLQELFAAQFSIANACLLVGYSVAGWLGATAGLAAAFVTLGLVAVAAAVAAVQLWPRPA